MTSVSSLSLSLPSIILLQIMSDKMQEEVDKKQHAQQPNDKGLLVNEWSTTCASGVPQGHSTGVGSWLTGLNGDHEHDVVEFLISGTGNDEGMTHVRPIVYISSFQQFSLGVTYSRFVGIGDKMDKKEMKNDDVSESDSDSEGLPEFVCGPTEDLEYDSDIDDRGSAGKPPHCSPAWNAVLAKMKARLRRKRRHCHFCNAVPQTARICKGCKNARYCGTTCQRQHWSVHKPECMKNAQTMWPRYVAGQSCHNCLLLSPVAFRCVGCVDQANAPWYCSQLCRSLHAERHATKVLAVGQVCLSLDID
jgi:hypothetical protein